MNEFRVTDYGAAGNGFTNDTNAFRAAADAVNAAGGGTLVIPPGVYVVGWQKPGEHGNHYAGQEILHIRNCNKPVVIRGEAADGVLPRLKAADGLRFGSFDPATGEPYTPPSMPFLQVPYRADAYAGMIQLTDNTGSVVVQDLELDGNLPGLELGGPYGDRGWQLGATGILAMGCSNLQIRNVHAHHHAQDGLMLGFPGLTAHADATPHLLEDVTSEYNGRQALSWIGGIGLTAVRCKFNHSGQGGLSSPPGAGVDVEPEGSVCRKGRFLECEFLDNQGVGFVADNGDTADVRLVRCRFLGTMASAIWPAKPRIVFENCEIYGNTVHTYGSIDPAEATQFLRCHFEDRAYLAGRPVFRGNWVIDANGYNVLYDRCTVVGNEVGALYLDLQDTREHIRDTVVIHRGAREDPYLSVISGSVLENVEFRDELPAGAAGPWYINAWGVEIRGTIWVEGPRLRWTDRQDPPGVIGGSTRSGLEFQRVLHYGTAPPVAGEFQTGDLIFNRRPAAGGPVAWICASAGAPGSWTALGPCAPTSVMPHPAPVHRISIIRRWLKRFTFWRHNR